MDSGDTKSLFGSSLEDKIRIVLEEPKGGASPLTWIRDSHQIELDGIARLSDVKACRPVAAPNRLNTGGA